MLLYRMPVIHTLLAKELKKRHKFYIKFEFWWLMVNYEKTEHITKINHTKVCSQNVTQTSDFNWKAMKWEWKKRSIKNDPALIINNN